MNPTAKPIETQPVPEPKGSGLPSASTRSGRVRDVVKGRTSNREKKNHNAESEGTRRLQEFLAAPPEVQHAFMSRLRQHARAERDFENWLAASESDPVLPAPPATELARRPLRWDRSWSRRAKGLLVDHPDRLSDIPAAEYVPALTGEEGRIVCCPLPDHDERTGSFWVYPDDRGWYCFGCGRGGDIYALAGYLWGIDHRGSGFREIRQRLEAELAGGRQGA